MKTISAGRCIYVLYSVHGVEIFFYKLTKEMLIKNVCPDFFYISFQGKEGLQSQILLLSPWLHDVLVDLLALKNLTDFKVSLTQMSQRLKQILPGFFPLLHGIVRFICDTLSGDRFFCDFSFQYQMILIFLSVWSHDFFYPS